MISLSFVSIMVLCVQTTTLQWPFDDILFTEHCQGTEYVNGKWIFDKSVAAVYTGGGEGAPSKPTNKSFVCCGWNTNDYLDNEIVNFCNRNPHYREEYRGTDLGGEHPQLLSSGGHACMCDEFDNTRLIKSEREKWIWKPTNCKLRLWNGSQFCEVLGKRTVMLIGDSTMQQTAGTLMNMIQSYQPRPTCSANIIFGRSNELSSVEVIEYITRYKPSYIILSAGAHFYSPSDYYKRMRATLKSIRKFRLEKHKHFDLNNLNSTLSNEDEQDFIQTITGRSNDHKFIWKTINPAHLSCDDYHMPADKYQTPTAEDKFGWSWFHAYDKMMLQMTVEYGLDIIDMRPLYFRPDAHPGKRAFQWNGDCLHYCMPGPLDIFSTFLLNYLANEREKMS